MTRHGGWVRSLLDALLHSSGRSEQGQANAMAFAALRPSPTSRR